jgi:hypothetical protein
MSRFIVTFMKDVLGENGHMCEVCQSNIELEAPSGPEAVEKAKALFCQSHATRDWSLHADRLRIEPADFPS